MKAWSVAFQDQAGIALARADLTLSVGACRLSRLLSCCAGLHLRADRKNLEIVPRRADRILPALQRRYARAGLSQAKLAARTGTSRSTIARLSESVSDNVALWKVDAAVESEPAVAIRAGLSYLGGFRSISRYASVSIRPSSEPNNE
jgi:DNA-binding XRE family transcriptional regulator